MIIVEDSAHSTLIKSILPSSNVVIAGDKYRVGKKVLTTPNCIGVVDEDSNNSPSTKLRLIKNLKPISDKHFIKVYTGTEFNKIIVICPIEVEHWLLWASKNSKVDIRDFGLANTHNDLKKEFSFKLKKVKELIATLSEVNCNELAYFKSLLV